MKTKHTPGPWRTGTRERGRFCVYAPAENGRGICVMSNTQKDSPEHDENRVADANARLIAAAPDLLAALQDILSGQLTGNVDLDAARFATARAVIAKATGE